VETYNWLPPVNPGEPWRISYGASSVWYLGYVATLCDTPEPGTWMLVLLGAGGAWWMRRGRVGGT
jgi:hypothetical protein